MVESETTCAVEGINGLVWFNGALVGTGNHFLLFALLFTLFFHHARSVVTPRIQRRLALVSNRSIGRRPLERRTRGRLFGPPK